MAELIAHGSSFENRWRRRLPPGTEIVLGRACHGFTVAWDNQISRQHATLLFSDDGLRVRKLPKAGNPVFYRGTENEDFTLTHGEHFVIGETTFNFTVNQAMATVDVPNPIKQKSFSHQFLKQVRYRDADRRISVLNRLPDVIASAANEEDLLTKMVNTLLAGIPSASAIGVVKYQIEEEKTEVVHWDRRSLSGGDFEASQRLIRQSVEGGDTVLHFWDKTVSQSGSGKNGHQFQYTFDMTNDWAFACPLENTILESARLKTPAQDSDKDQMGDRADSAIDPSTDGSSFDVSSADRWVIYVTGRNKLRDEPTTSGKPIPQLPPSSGEMDLEGDIKFCELIAATLCNLLQLRKLEQRQSSLRRFFSPAVLSAFANENPESVLRPRQCLVSVLFCDLRGFSKTSEALSDDLLKLLSIVSQSLGVMTKVILQKGGVIGDFHGDAAMGFWGWPIDQPDGALRAVNAAVEIQSQIKRMSAENKTDVFKMGIGIGTGEAVAGRIGTDDQVKVTAFGPVVNVASRLESMTQQLGCSILIDEATAKALPANSTCDNAPCDKPLWTPIPFGQIQPFAMDRSVGVFRVQNSQATHENHQPLSSDQVRQITEAVKAFESGTWDVAKKLLENIPNEDPTKTLLLNAIQESGAPPEDFKGLIAMKRK